jgi:lysozyme
MKKITFFVILVLCLPLISYGESVKNMTKIETLLLKHEGYERYVYRCTADKLTVGIGRNLESNGLTMEESLYLLRNDIKRCEYDLHGIFNNFGEFSEDRQNVLIDMRFNLGAEGFREFKKMIAAIRTENFILAAHEMTKSRWYEQVGDRSQLLTGMMIGPTGDE